MKKLILLLLAFLPNVIFSQTYFNGQIHYKTSLESKSPNVTKDQLIQVFGTGSDFYYQNGDYLQIFENSILEFDFLDVSNKKYYMKYRNNDTLYQYSVAEYEIAKMVSLSDSKETKNILGYPCKKLDLKAVNQVDGSSFMLSFYFSDRIKINKEKYIGFKYGFAEQVYGQTGSIPLENIMSTPIFVVTITAISITPNNNLSIRKDFEKRKKGLILKNK